MVNENVAYVLKEDIEQNVEIAESPVKYCSVALSEVIKKGKRLEASVFDVEAKRARQRIEHGLYPVKMIGGDNGVATSYVCGRFKRIWVKKSDLPIFQPSSITDVYPSPDGYISHKTRTNTEELRVHAGQILMTCSGTIGKLSYVSKTLENKIFSHDLLRINCKETADAGYVYTYLKSAIGNKILLTNQYGAVITHIEPEHLATVPIPVAPEKIKKRINDLIVSSYQLRDESNDLIDEATALLKKELHFPAIEEFDVSFYKKNANVDTFNVRLSNMAERVDASYHVPIVDSILKHMKQNAAEVTTVGDKRISKTILLPPRFARVYVEEGYGRVLIGGKQIFELDPSVKKYLSRTKHNKLMAQLEVNQNTILITRSGTIGKVVLVPKHWEHWVPSDHIIRIVPAKEEIAGYLSVFLSSEYGYRLIARYTYGSVVDEIDDIHVGCIPFPLLKDAKNQHQINELALLANKKRFEAYKREQQALQIMDREVIFAK